MPTIAVIADIHGNILALEAVLADIARRGIDQLVNLGDCLSGPLWPRQTASKLRALDLPTVRGNHDRVLASVPPANMGPSDRYANDAIDDADRLWLSTLPAEIVFHGALCLHGTRQSDVSYLLERSLGGQLITASPGDVASRLQPGFPIVLCAHSHRPTLMRVSKEGVAVTVINPGSVGAPAFHSPALDVRSESASPYARYAILTMAQDRPVAIDHCAVSYDWQAASDRALQNGRADWAHALASGFMPAL